MWFKNLRVYRLTKPFTETAETLEPLLEDGAFTPCSHQQTQSIGWCPPLGRHGQTLAHTASGRILLCVKRQEKVLPAAVINEQLEEQVLAIQEKESRHVSRKERQTLKEDIQITLLPKAFAKSQMIRAYIDPQASLVVVDAASAKRAEEILNLLRDAVGSLSVIPLTCKNIPTQTLTTWLANSTAPKPFTLGEECELEAPKDEGRVIRCKNQDLSAPEFLKHLDTGMFVRKLALNWNDAVDCVVDHELAIKRLKFADALIEKVDERAAESIAEELDQTFALMSVEVTHLIEDLTRAMGGVGKID